MECFWGKRLQRRPSFKKCTATKWSQTIWRDKATRTEGDHPEMKDNWGSIYTRQPDRGSPWIRDYMKTRDSEKASPVAVSRCSNTLQGSSTWHWKWPSIEASPEENKQQSRPGRFLSKPTNKQLPLSMYGTPITHCTTIFTECWDSHLNNNNTFYLYTPWKEETLLKGAYKIQ